MYMQIPLQSKFTAKADFSLHLTLMMDEIGFPGKNSKVFNVILPDYREFPDIRNN